MALEIERRFLVAGDGWQPHRRWSRRLSQGYLVSGAEGPTLRVRSDGEGAAWLTLKFPAEGQGIARPEFEYAIPAADADELLQRCPVVLQKWRHGLDLPGGDWVLDVFEAENAPLVIAEVELARADQPVVVPPWCALEISAEAAFSNAALARRPFSTWTDPEREPWLRRLQAGPA
jgi:CYTH domain-containing protein